MPDALEETTFDSQFDALQQQNNIKASKPENDLSCADQFDLKTSSNSALFDSDSDAQFNRIITTLCIYDLSENEKLGSEIERELNDLYGNKEHPYRHNYSDITGVMYACVKNDKQIVVGIPNSFMLAEANCRILSDAFLAGQYPEDVIKSVKKLRDHVLLEYTRMKFSSSQYAALADETNSLQSIISDSKVDVDNLTKDISAVSENIASLQRETIAILGIFSAVVLVTNSGISFVTGTVQESSQLGVAALGFVVVLVGAVIFDALVSLFTFIYRLVRKDDDRWAFISKDAFLNVNIGLLALAAIMFTASIALE